MRRAPALLAATMLTIAAGASPSIETGALEPFGLASALLRVDESHPDGLELHGVLADGGRAALFSARYPEWRSSVEARFFVPDGLAALELLDAGSGEVLARLKAPSPALDGASLAARRRLRLASFPLRGPGGGRPAELLSLSRADYGSAARAASTRLFVAPRRPVALAVLAAWVLLVLIAAAVAPGRPGWPLFGPRGLMGLGLACLGAAALAAALGRPGAARWELALPPGEPPWSLEARLVADAKLDGARVLAWADESAGPLAFVAFHDPTGHGLPLGAWARGRLRFSRQPRVELGADGVYRLEARRFLMAWRLDDAR